MSASNIKKLIKDKEVEYDLRFTDPRGKLQHLTMDSTVVDEDMLEKGVFFDGSSIAGWKAITSRYDFKTRFIRPNRSFNFHTTLNIFCYIMDAVKKDSMGEIQGHRKSRELFKKTGIGDKAYLVLEEFFFSTMLI